MGRDHLSGITRSKGCWFFAFHTWQPKWQKSNEEKLPNFIVLEMWKHHMSCKSINMKVVVTLQSSGKTMQNQAGSITKVLETSCPKFLLSQCHGGPIGCNSLQNPHSQCRAHHRNIMHQLLTFQFSRWFFFRKQKSTWSPHPLAPCTPWAYSDLEGLNPTPGEAVGILQTSTSRWNDLQMLIQLMLKEECAGTSLHHTFDFRPVFLFLRNVRPACRSAPHNWSQKGKQLNPFRMIRLFAGTIMLHGWTRWFHQNCHHVKSWWDKRLRSLWNLHNCTIRVGAAEKKLGGDI